MNSIILSAATRVLTPLMLLFSVFMLLRGHNDPGGGFIGGLVAAIGLTVYAISHSVAAARHALRIEPAKLAMIGLGIALAAGLLPIFTGGAFFTGQWLFIGGDETSKGLPISSVLVFDIGVYLVVVGAVLTLTFALEEEIG